ncbi:hypothetical protein WQ54_28140 [Bacillus sp. SA1-12]|uniref:ABC transporter permease n=1 Tax=Bacillus sp. SA1-12 TaxID=1455638 RepID=UPI0006270786|nr:ABC transporter permease [Bacillus sp. SA1-12]KKI89096.1 hypothetical protein WQ54_28140 [Bacillus sp. SA1-12]
MRSKKSFFKIGIIKQDMRQHGWISLIYFLLLLFTVPLELMQLASRENVLFEDYKNYFFINTELQVLILHSIPVAAGLILFRYLQNEASVDMVHSLPIRRETIYVSHILSGLLLLLVPIVLTSIVLFFVTNSIVEFHSILTFQKLLFWTGLMILITSMVFIFTAAVGMITGMSSAQAVLTYIFLFLPFGLVTLVSYNLSFFLFGYSSYYTEQKLTYLSPFMRFFELWTTPKPFSIIEVVIYTILTIGFFLIGMGLYKARHLEKATEVIAFPILKPVFKYGVTFCSMVFGGSYFSAAGSLHWNWILFGYCIGALLGYVIAEMILQKSWRIFHFRLFTGFICYSIIFIVLFVGIETDIINYEKKLPQMEQINGVYFGNKYEVQEQMSKNSDVYSNSKPYIQDVRNLHEYIISQQEFLENDLTNQMDSQEMMISYRLNNGKLFTREYKLPANLVTDQVKPVMEAEDYKLNLREYTQLREDITAIRVIPNGPAGSFVTITNREEITELTSILKKEILSQTFEELTSPISPWGYFELSTKSVKDRHQFEGYSISWKKSYDAISAWLDLHGYLDDARITSNEIANAEITKINNIEAQEYYSADELFRLGEQAISVKDQNMISSLLEKFTDQPENQTYFIKFTLKDGNEWYGAIPENVVPEEVKNKLK